MKRLNNMVVELARGVPKASDEFFECEFESPRSGWHYVGCSWDGESGDVRFVVDGRAAGTRPAFGSLVEAMLQLPAGPHTLRVEKTADGRLGEVCVRAVPELAYCKHQYNPHIPEYGPYDWDFIARTVLPHVNTVVGNGDPSHEEHLKWWKARGGKWIVETSLHGMNDETVTAADVWRNWTSSPGMVHPLMDGIMVDEFFSGRRPQYKAWTEAMSRIASDKRFEGKKVYPYLGSHYPDMDDWKRNASDGVDSSYRFLATTMQAGYPIAWERYLQERHSEDCAEEHIQDRLGSTIAHWRHRFPDCARSLLVCLGYMTITETLNIHPGADYKVFMDMQFRFLANHPDFEGLFGILEYTSGYADEETLRWAARLYRHYGIEGETDLLSDRLGYSYVPGHLRNPDFAFGWEGWHVPVDIEENVHVRHCEGFGHLQGRWPRTSVGDSFLTMKRDAKIPNVVSQRIKNLQPGRMYSAKMISGSYDQLLAGKSKPEKLGITLSVAGVETIPKNTFQSVVANNYSHELGAFEGQNHYWFNHHQVVFRATSPSAELFISDWEGSSSDGRPAGPLGETLLCNFVEVQPYFEEGV